MKKTLLFVILTLTTQVFAAKSNIEREDKSLMVTASPLLFEYSTLAISAEIGKFLSPNEILSLQLTALREGAGTTTYGDEDSESDESDEIWEEAGKGFALNINYKKFFGQTFYIKPSVYYKSQNIVKSTSSIGGVLVDKEAGYVHDLGIGFKVGNQWQWSKFTLGCDWIGYNKKIALLDISGNLDEDVYQDSLSLLNLYLGMSF